MNTSILKKILIFVYDVYKVLNLIVIKSNKKFNKFITYVNS